MQGELDHAAGAPLGTAGWVGSGFWESCRFAEARFKAILTGKMPVPQE
jgi:hypothetical protein